MYFVRIIDENGLFLYDDFVDELTEYTIITPCPAGFYLPKWDGAQWIEGGTSLIITAQEPTIEERLQAAENALLVLMGGV